MTVDYIGSGVNSYSYSYGKTENKKDKQSEPEE